MEITDMSYFKTDSGPLPQGVDADVGAGQCNWTFTTIPLLSVADSMDNSNHEASGTSMGA